ncbi:MAG: cellulase family glycosylhydrolase, partial [Pseudonocardia sp.]|nr:cellulase family glycosylhydrolase [Pseudonocardia sp.]
MPGTSHRARYALGATIVALSFALLVGALPYLRGASADNTRELIKVSFRPANTEPADGWRSDHGEAYDARRAYGWVRDNSSGAPLSMASYATSRSRAASPDRGDTFILMQPPHRNWGRWVMDVPNGTYRVTATVGDASAAAGTQNLAVEGRRLIEGFTPTAGEPTRSATIDVVATDGRLTVDPLYPDASSRTKLVSLVVSEVLEDQTPPTTEPPGSTIPPTTVPPTTVPPITIPPVTIPPITLPPTTLPSSGLKSQTGFGTGGAFMGESDPDIKREFDGMAATGATWVRLPILWSSIEQSPGVYWWSRQEQVVGWARERGLRVIANVSYTPKWARPAGCPDMKCPPADLDLYARFLHQLVAHFSPLGVKTYEIWNEPNQSFWWMPKPSPARYAELVRKADLQAHLADPTVTVLAGVFAPAADNESGTTISPVTFLQGMYKAGVLGHFDALAFHPYTQELDPRLTVSWNMITSIGPQLSQVMQS